MNKMNMKIVGEHTLIYINRININNSKHKRRHYRKLAISYMNSAVEPAEKRKLQRYRDTSGVIIIGKEDSVSIALSKGNKFLNSET